MNMLTQNIKTLGLKTTNIASFLPSKNKVPSLASCTGTFL
jgi:hypothetical protein